jgi:Rod binding domain-containing protein
MNMLDINNSYYQNRPTLDKMQRAARTAKATVPAAHTGGLAPLQAPVIDKKSPLYKACQDFESIFIKQMLNVMRKTVEKSGLLDGGMAEDVFEDMLYDEYAKLMAQNANFGLTEILYKQLSAKVR